MTSPFRRVIDEKYNAMGSNQTRWRGTIQFVGQEVRPPGKDCLDIGDRSVLTGMLEVLFDSPFANTSVDLDIWSGSEYSNDQFDVITCFEVIEHLFNPLYCLREMKKILKPGGRIYLSTPRYKPLILWDKYHFHEMTDKSLFTLIEKAGLTVVRRKKICFIPWRMLLYGFRPWLRKLLARTWLLELKAAE